MTEPIATLEALEACVGTAALATRMKIIDHLDGAARDWIGASPLAFAGFAAASGPRLTLAGGAAGFAAAIDATRLSLPRASLDDAAAAEAGQGVGLLFLVPGAGETLRVNGRVAAAGGEAVEISVEECFLHCAKALIRSDFWSAAPREDVPEEAAAFLAASRFLALATADAEGCADVSPKGDPAGSLIRLQDGVASLAERPGNKLAFGYRNMIACPAVAALALVPGSTRIAVVSGKARLTTDEAVRQAFAVDGKAPILATMIGEAAPEIRTSAALERAALWPLTDAAAIDPAAVLVAHVKLNKAKGEAANAIRAGVSREGVAAGLEQSYRTKLY